MGATSIRQVKILADIIPHPPSVSTWPASQSRNLNNACAPFKPERAINVWTFERFPALVRCLRRSPRVQNFATRINENRVSWLVFRFPGSDSHQDPAPG